MESNNSRSILLKALRGILVTIGGYIGSRKLDSSLILLFELPETWS
jgi:hypothetical protein